MARNKRKVLCYPFVLSIDPALTSSDQSRPPLRVDPLPDGQVADAVPAAVPPLARRCHRSSGDIAALHLREAPERRPESVQEPAGASSHSESRHHCPTCALYHPSLPDGRLEPIGNEGRD